MKKVSNVWLCSASFVAALVGMATLPLVPATAQISHPGPSFSCRMAEEGSVEDMICADAALSRQDRILATAFSRARTAVHGSEGHGALLASQQAFLRERGACMDLRTQKGPCVQHIVSERIDLLNDWTRLKMDPSRVSSRPAKMGTTQGSRPPSGPSFECRRAGNVVERAICDDRSLSILDREMAGLFRRATAKAARTDAPILAREQREFIINRDHCSARTADRNLCIQVAYEMRNQRLGEWIETGTANP
jgi:uncharacterized protein